MHVANLRKLAPLWFDLSVPNPSPTPTTTTTPDPNPNLSPSPTPNPNPYPYPNTRFDLSVKLKADRKADQIFGWVLEMC